MLNLFLDKGQALPGFESAEARAPRPLSGRLKLSHYRDGRPAAPANSLDSSPAYRQDGGMTKPPTASA